MASNQNFYDKDPNLQFIFISASLGVEGPPQKKLFVANLPYFVDERNIREVFGIAGRVVMVKLNRDKEGKFLGHGVLEYGHEKEAVQAISMLNGQIFHKRKMAVRFDKTRDAPASGPSSLPKGLEGVGMGLGVDGKAIFHEVSKEFLLF